MKKFYVFLVILGLGLLQASFLDKIKLFGVKPDLLLLCAVMAALSFEWKWAIVFCAAAGLLKDIFSVSVFGANAFLFALWGYIIFRLGRKISFEEDILRYLLVLGVALINNIACGLVSAHYLGPVPLGIFIRIVILGSLYTTLAFVLVCRIRVWTE